MKSFNRENTLIEINDHRSYDVLVIGGGATGAGIALDASSRGFKTLLIEKRDFSQGTSSRSTKLIHGGVRYLQQGNLSLVLEALQERDLLMKNAPKLVKPLPIDLPIYQWWQVPYYYIGLRIYDLLAGRRGFKKTSLLSKKTMAEFFPNLSQNGLKAGIRYYDGQFNDAELVLAILKEATQHGAACINYMECIELIKENERCVGVVALDIESKQHHTIRAKTIINATGVFAENMIQMDDRSSNAFILPSQGSHIVVDSKHFSNTAGFIVPKTTDGRVLFSLPWQGKTILGTTDVALAKPTDEPRATTDEVDFILKNINRYLEKKITRSDIMGVFAGLRPLLKPNKVKSAEGPHSHQVSREHKIFFSLGKMVNVVGGKWTTHRKMAEEAVDFAIAHQMLPKKKCITKKLKLNEPFAFQHDAKAIMDASHTKWISEKYKLTNEHVLEFIENSMARTLEDILSRRTRLFILDQNEAKRIAPEVVKILGGALNKNKDWLKDQLNQFESLCDLYTYS